MIYGDIKELLKIFGINYFPTKEELKKLFNNKIKEFHPDKNKDSYAHEKTIELMKAYQSFLSFYSFYREEYLKEIKTKDQSRKVYQEDDYHRIIQVFNYQDFYLGLPLYGLESFLNKDDISIIEKNQKYYINYNNNLYLIVDVDKNLLERIKQKKYYCFVLYNKPALFSICIREKIKYAFTIEIDTKLILWNQHYGSINYLQNTIYLPSCFKNLYINQNEVIMPTH